MNKLFQVLIVCLLFISCKEKSSNETSNTSDSSKESTLITSEKITIGNYNVKIDPIKETDYTTLKNNDKNRNIINKFCLESKGYLMNEWLGTNECGWAVEKFKIEQDKDFVSRTNNELILINKEGKKVSLTNENPDQENAVYYRYRRMLTTGYHVVEVIKEKSCPEYRLYNVSTGKHTVLNGVPHFSKNNQFVFLTNYINNSGKWCANEIQLHKITDNDVIKEWSHKPENSIFLDAEWANDNDIYLSRYLKYGDLKNKEYAKINIARK